MPEQVVLHQNENRPTNDPRTQFGEEYEVSE